MYLEKPNWIRHGGLQIFSLDIQPTGPRVATAGGDHKVRIWSMKTLTNVLDDQPKLLATLHNYCGSVNCVRWAKSGRFLASGSDDYNVVIHQRRADTGTGTAKFGSREPPDVENWKVSLTFRGHTSDVVDLQWSPDDSMLASCCLDNTVRVWDTGTGAPVAVLKDHRSSVEGVAWDPIGSFLASQSDDRCVIIWRTSNWTMAHRAEGSREKAVGSTIFMRLDWSPCGHHLATTNGFQKPRHRTPVLKRAEWGAFLHFVGHNAPVIAVRFNHAMFEKVSVPNGAQHADGVVSRDSREDKPFNVVAMGSRDCSVSVWSTASPTPVCVAQHFFDQSVVDLAWSADGYTLLCCSLDGTVAALEFGVRELGHRIGNEEMDEIKRKVYGDVRVKQLAQADNPAQLLFEGKTARGLAPVRSVVAQSSQEANVPAAVSSPPKVREVMSYSDQDPVADARPSAAKLQQPRSTVRQMEYRRPHGGKRIVPESMGLPSVPENAEAVGRPEVQRKLSRLEAGDIGDARRSFINARNGDVSVAALEGVTTRTNFSTGVPVDPKLSSTNPSGLPGGLITVPANKNPLGVLSIIGQSILGSGVSVCLEAKPVRVARIGNTDGIGGLDAYETHVTCSRGGAVLWQDRLMGRPTTLAGNAVFWAVALAGGVLQIYSQAGRRALPGMMIGSAAAFMDCGEGWNLLLLTCQGCVYLWDLKEATCVLRESLAPLLNTYFGSSVNKDVQSLRVVSARLSKAGAPLVVLANRQTFMYHVGRKCWLRIADDTFPASEYISKGCGKDGELAATHAQEARGRNLCGVLLQAMRSL